MNLSNLYKQAYKVRDAKELHENTASRVGNLFVGILDNLADSGALSDLINQAFNSISSKLDKATFDDLFEKVNLGTEASPDWAIKAKYGLFTERFLSAKGLPKGGAGSTGASALYELSDVELTSPAEGNVLQYIGGKWVNSAISAGLDETALSKYLTDNNYAKLSDIHPVDLSEYIKRTTADSLYQPKGDYASAASVKTVSDRLDDFLTGSDTDNIINKWKELEGFLSGMSETDNLATLLSGKVDKRTGYGLSKNDFTDTLLAKLNGIAEGANKYVLPVAKAAVLGGVMIGSTLTASAAGVLDLPALHSAPLTHCKVTVDRYGRVTSGASLAEGDIPSLSISKITGLQNALDRKLDKSVFDDLFEKVNIGTSASPVWAIKAKYGLFTERFLSAKGRPVGDGSGSSGGVSYDRLDNWVDYSAAKAGYVLSAKLGHELYLTGNSLLQRVSALEAKPDIDLSPYVTLATPQTISAVKTFTQPVVVATTAMPLSGGKCTGLTAATSRLYRDALVISNPATPNDLGWMRVTGTGESDTVLEIATGDDAGAGETIVFRGYNTGNAIAYSVAVPKKSGTIALTSDIPASMAWSAITGKPTTLGGYGITDAVTLGTAQTITGLKTYTAEQRFSNSVVGAYSDPAPGVACAIKASAPVSATSFIRKGGTSSQFLMADGSVRTARTRSTVGDLTWSTQADGDGNIPTIALLAFWNGRYNGSSSNLQYCDRGRFGSIITMGSSDYLRAYGTSNDNIDSDWGQSVRTFDPKPSGTPPEPNANITLLSLGNSFARRKQLAFVYDSDNIYYRRRIDSGFTSWVKLLHTGNYTGVLDARYVNVTGDTMTGALHAPSFHVTSASSGAWISSDNAKNLFVVVSGEYMTVWDKNDNTVRPGGGQGGKYNLGRSTERWANLYANTINVTSSALVSNLNADLLDGVQGADFFQRARTGMTTAYVDLTSYSPNATGYANYSPGTYMIARSGHSELVVHFAANTGSASALQLRTSYGDADSLMYRKTIDSNRVSGPWRKIVTELNIGSYNAGSATRLATSRAIWGHNFDGTGNVNGCVYIQADAGDYREGIRIKPYGNWSTVVLGGNDLTADTGTSAASWSIHNNNGKFYINRGGASAHTGYELSNTNGNWGVGKMDAQYKLDVAGSIIADSWIRTRGATGWYNETYGGGWYMTDTTWVRVFNGKSVNAGSGQIRSDYAFNRTTGYVGTSWNKGHGAYNVEVADNNQQTPLLLAYRQGSAFNVEGANRLFAMEFLNNGTNLRFCFGGAYKVEFFSSGDIHAVGNVYSNKAVSAKGLPTSSDERLKTDMRDVILPWDVLLKAPSMSFLWRDDTAGGRRGGTIAQYWERRFKEVVYTRPDGYLAVDYGVLAHVECISLAHHMDDELTRLKKRVETLERENKELRQLIRA